MLFAMLQEQHNKQIAAMTATNKPNMDVMMERMNALVAGNGGNKCTVPNQQPYKENITPEETNQPKKPRKKKPSVATAKHLSFTNLKTVLSSRQTRTSAGKAGSRSMPTSDRDR